MKYRIKAGVGFIPCNLDETQRSQLMADNFIEADGGAYNIRIFENRGINVYHSALSGQPVFGGPAYYIRNVCHSWGDSLKFSARPTGLVVYNNTFCSETRPAQYSNALFRNNLFLGPFPDRPTLSSMSYTSYTSFDYNGCRNKLRPNLCLSGVSQRSGCRTTRLHFNGGRKVRVEVPFGLIHSKHSAPEAEPFIRREYRKGWKLS